MRGSGLAGGDGFFGLAIMGTIVVAAETLTNSGRPLL